jgi:signal transduction histidine kinase
LRDVFIFEAPLARPRISHEGNANVAGWKIRLGLYTAETRSIQRQAYLQLAISVLAVLTLIILSMSLIHTLNRFLEMKVREGAEAQLKSLGVMAASLAHEIRNPLRNEGRAAQEDLPQERGAARYEPLW